MSEIELKPCPFCGDSEEVEARDQMGAWWVVCGCCGARSFGGSKAGAIEGWNTRSQSERVSRLEEALTWIEREYENQDLNHKDFRVEAYRRARSALNQGTDDGR